MPPAGSCWFMGKREVCCGTFLEVELGFVLEAVWLGLWLWIWLPLLLPLLDAVLTGVVEGELLWVLRLGAGAGGEALALGGGEEDC